MLIQPSEFINKYELSNGMYDTPKIEAYILKYEEQYLVHLFGARLYNQFVSDLVTNVPRSPNFLRVFNAFNEDMEGFPLFYNQGIYGTVSDRILQSDGIVEMLLGFIYFEYAKDLMNQQTPYGNVKQRAENSVVVDSPHSMMYGRYNTAIKTYRAIQTRLFRDNVSLGQIVTVSIVNAGATYVDGTYDLLGGDGSEATATITTLAGAIDTVEIAEQGKNYSIGDVLTIDGGDGLGTIQVDYVGIGDYKLFNGIAKGTAYWI